MPHLFRMIYNFAIAVTRIHFAICKVQSNNSNCDTSNLVLKSNLDSLKPEIGKMDINKLKIGLADLIEQNNVGDNDI